MNIVGISDQNVCRKFVIKTQHVLWLSYCSLYNDAISKWLRLYSIDSMISGERSEMGME